MRPVASSAVVVLWSAYASVAVARPAAVRVVARPDVHTVRSGESLASIAQRYHLSVGDLCAENRLETRAQVRAGTVLHVPPEDVVFVRSGERAAEIAARTGTSVRDLLRANHLDDAQSLQRGQRLRIPGRAHEQAHTRSRYGEPRRSGFVRMIRDATHRPLNTQFVDARGRVSLATQRRLAEHMRPHGARARQGFPTPPVRLLQTLARISDHFGGHVIHIVSGFREPGGFTRDSSQHTQGHAIDIRVEGVPNTELRDFARTLNNVGVGYYPRSTFVHIDVRDRSAYWVDWSRPGQAPQYQRRGQAPPSDAEAGELENLGEGGEETGAEEQ